MSISLFFQRAGLEVVQMGVPDRGTLRVGRATDCDVCLPDPDCLLSRVHCELRAESGGVAVVDRSVNGVRLDGRRLARGAPRLVRAGKVLELPGWTITVRREAGRIAESTVERGCVSAESKPGLDGLVGAAPAMHVLRRRIERVASFGVPVLVHGETGTGKELVSRAVHDLSRRAGGPFVAVNCGAIHGETAHSRLFGHERGAFTGAATAAPGAFRQAHGGTLFLDEIGELSPEHQTALLRVLETQEVTPLGASKPVRVDYRLVAASHRELRAEVAAGRFREDLYFRLDVAVLRVPPLRDRLEDVPMLARHFLGQLAAGRGLALSDDAVAVLESHTWPGNVRELRATLQRALLTVEGTKVGARDIHLRRPLRSVSIGGLAAVGAGPVAAQPNWKGPLDWEQVERGRILEALTASRGNRKAAAQALGVARSTLYARMERLGLL